MKLSNYSRVKDELQSPEPIGPREHPYFKAADNNLPLEGAGLCAECGAHVPRQLWDRHGDWHRRLDMRIAGAATTADGRYFG